MKMITSIVIFSHNQLFD